tara:strand:+ start:440 stop:733 length:294 start_codon:yes stop_codon:yes gene_type:complete
MKTNETIYYARKCSITNEGMNEGWLDEQNLMYFKYVKDVIKYIKECMQYETIKPNLNQMNDDDIIEYGYNHYDIYFTEWECEFDLQYKKVNNKLIEL